MNPKPSIIYEENAEQVTLNGWACKSCHRFYGNDARSEHHARWCCATDIPCECGGRNTNKHYIICQACRDRKDEERWQAAKAKATSWDGEWPLCVWMDDTYFWSDCDIECYLDNNEMQFDDLQLCVCEPAKHPSFDMSDYLCDYLPDDDNTDYRAIDQLVNDWIRDCAPKVFFGTNQVVTLESVREALGWKEEDADGHQR